MAEIEGKISLIDLFLGNDYCDSAIDYNNCMFDAKSYYIDNDLASCKPPNQYLQQHPELLYKDQQCIFNNSAELTTDDVELIADYLKDLGGKKELGQILDYNLQRLIDTEPEAVEKLFLKYAKDINFFSFKPKVFYALKQHTTHLYSDEFFTCLEKESKLVRQEESKRDIIDFFLVKAAFHETGSESLDKVLNFIYADIDKRIGYLGEVALQYQKLPEKNYDIAVYDKFSEVVTWLDRVADRVQYQKFFQDFIITGISQGKYLGSGDNKELLALYASGYTLSDKAINGFSERFANDAVSFHELIEVIVDNESRLNDVLAHGLLRGSLQLTEADDEKLICKAVYFIRLSILQKSELLADDLKQELQEKLEELQGYASSKIKNLAKQTLLYLKGEVYQNSSIYVQLNEDIKRKIEAVNETSAVKKQIKYFYEYLGWQERDIEALFLQAKETKNKDDFINAIHKIYLHRSPISWLDRNGNNCLDILLSSEQKEQDIFRLYKDNNISYDRKAEEIIKQLESAGSYKQGDFLRNKLVEMKLIETELAKEIVISWEKPIEKNKWYVGIEEENIYIEGSHYRDKYLRLNIGSYLSEDEYVDLRNILLYQQPVRQHSLEVARSSLVKMQMLELRNAEVNDENIAEIVVWLKKAAYFSTFEKQFTVRDAQVISLLNLYKGSGGILLEVGTGEGKSVIISMFAALQVIAGENVDIITSSQVLAERDTEEQRNFYGLLGISVGHNIGGGVSEEKSCYRLDIVYGDILHFIGDDLRDITKQIKYGRGHGVLIVDEVDNMFIDQTVMKVQLSEAIPGFEHLRRLHIPLWVQYNMMLSMLQYENGNFYWGMATGEENLKGAEIGDINDLELTVKELLGSYGQEKLLDLETNKDHRLITLPDYLEEFVSTHINRWIESILQASSYNEQKEYVIKPQEKMNIVAPVDFANTGVIQENLKWSDGLHQFLQMKHGLSLTGENITSYFRSYVGYFLKYSGKIYGLSGTLGDKEQQEFLHKIYGVETIKIPSYTQKKLVIYPEQTARGEIEWLDLINKEVLKIGAERAVLIITKTIAEATSIITSLKKAWYSKNKIKCYWGSEHSNSIKDKLSVGEVVVATNLAGRGTDLKIAREVNKNGGLHVILSFLAQYDRVEKQAFGRAARNGDFGSAGMIIKQGEEVGEKSFADLIVAREEQEKAFLLDTENNTLKGMLLQDQLFNKFTELAKTINNPSGYKIKVRESATQSEKISVYNKVEEIFMDCTPLTIKAGKSLENSGLNITELLQDIDGENYRQIKLALAKETELKEREENLIHFIAAFNGCITADKKVIVDRVEQRYEVYARKNPKMSNIWQDKYKLWQQDRKDYNNSYIVKQLQENWGMWLREAGLMSNNLFAAKASDLNEQTNDKAIAAFEVFAAEQLESWQGGSFIKNPAYLLQEARHYMGVDARDIGGVKLSDKEYVKSPLQLAIDDIEKAIGLDRHFAWSGHNLGAYVKLIKDGMGIKKAKQADEAAKVKTKFVYDLQDSIAGIKQHMQPQQKALCVNMVATGVIEPEQDTIRQCLFNDLAWQKMVEHMESLVQKVQDSGKQMIRINRGVHLDEMFSKIAEEDIAEAQKNLVADSMELSLVDLQQEPSKEKKPDPEEEKKAEKTEQQEDVKLGNFGYQDKFQGQVFKANRWSPIASYSALMAQELYSGGFIAFDIELYDLKKDWTDTVLAAVMGIATIALGAVLISTGGPFLALLGKGLVFQGIGDCFSVVRAVIEGEPIRMEDFLKSKAIGVGIAILTAGIAYTGVNAGWFSVESVYGSDAVNAAAKATQDVANQYGLKWSSDMVAQNALKSSVTATQAAGAMGNMTGEVIKGAVTSSLIAEGVKEVADIGIKEYLKKNDGDIERDIGDELHALFNDYAEDLVSILASDIWGNRDILKRELLQDAGDIMRKYERGKTAMKIGKSLTNSAIGYGMPGWAAGVTNAAINVGSGAYKSLQAAEKFSQKFAGSIKEKAGKRKTTYAMFESRLQESYKHEWQDIIMKMRQYAGEFGQAEISYANCAKYSGVELGSEKKTAALVNICGEIAAVMEKASTESLAQLKAQLQDDLLGRIRGVYKNEMFHPTFDFIEFLGEKAWDKYKEKKQEEAQKEQEKKEQAAESRRAVADEVARILRSEDLNIMAETAQAEMTKAQQQKEQQRDNDQEGRPKNIIPEQFREKLKSVRVEAGDNVHKLYGEQASQDKLERFLAANPHVAARGVKRDSEGNITHIEIRAGEQVVLPEQTAAAVQQQREAQNNKQTTATPKQQSYSLPQPDDTSGRDESTVGKRDLPETKDKKEFSAEKFADSYFKMTSEQQQEVRNIISKEKEGLISKFFKGLHDLCFNPAEASTLSEGAKLIATGAAVCARTQVCAAIMRKMILEAALMAGKENKAAVEKLMDSIQVGSGEKKRGYGHYPFWMQQELIQNDQLDQMPDDEDKNIANDENNWYKNKNNEVKQSQQQKVSNTASNMPDPDDFDPEQFEPEKGKAKWEIKDPKEADKVMRHDKHGKFYRDPKQKYGNKEIWWTKDNAGHAGSQYKLYIRKDGKMQHIADTDKLGNMINKNKGPIGREISLKEFSGIK